MGHEVTMGWLQGTGRRQGVADEGELSGGEVATTQTRPARVVQGYWVSPLHKMTTHSYTKPCNVTGKSHSRGTTGACTHIAGRDDKEVKLRFQIYLGLVTFCPTALSGLASALEPGAMFGFTPPANAVQEFTEEVKLLESPFDLGPAAPIGARFFCMGLACLRPLLGFGCLFFSLFVLLCACLCRLGCFLPPTCMRCRRCWRDRARYMMTCLRWGSTSLVGIRCPPFPTTLTKGASCWSRTRPLSATGRTTWSSGRCMRQPRVVHPPPRYPQCPPRCLHHL